ncbi:hypothetical protein ACWEOE_31815 [Amycolatopsis sp. NPDC004368]
MTTAADSPILDDLRAAITAGARDLVDLSRAACAAGVLRGVVLEPHAVVAALGVLARLGEIEYTRKPRRGGYQPALHIRRPDCRCQPEHTGTGYRHRGPLPHDFAPADGDDVAPDGTTIEIHQ